MPDYQQIYQSQAASYHQLVCREDFQERIRPAIWQICSPAGRTVVELGAGTGRLTRLLAPLAGQVLALDRSNHMLGIARTHLRSAGDHLSLAVADNRTLPLASGSADLVVAGWTLGHLVGWHPQTWRREIGRSLAEMQRIARRPGGVVIILETLGTGRSAPSPPNEGLAAYYACLQDEWGFDSTWIRTDYRFASLREAERLTRFFFGDELAERVVREELVVLPECTGVWWRRS